MPTTSNFGWTTPADTDLVKDGAAAIRTLGNGIDTSLLDLKGGTTGQVLSKNSNTDLDYTWVTPNVGDITEVQAGTGISVASGTGPIPVVTNTVATTYDAKGDLVVGTGADTFAKLTVGTNGHTLVADSAETTGLKWVAPSSGAMALITRQTISNSGGTNIDSIFTSTYRTYFVVIENANTNGGTGQEDLQLQLRYSTTTQENSYKYQEVVFGSNYAATERNVAQLTLSPNVGDGSQNCSAFIWITRVGNTSEKAYFYGNSVDAYAGVPQYYNGYLNVAQTYTGLRLKTSSGNFDAVIAIYGLVEA